MPAQPFNPDAWNCRALLTSAEMKRAEQAAGPSFALMQRAGEAVAAAIITKWKPCRTLVLCGPGNNGGDGFICAEALRRRGWDVTAAAMKPPGQMTGDALQAATRWQGATVALEQASYDGVKLVVDALFGTGLARALEGAARNAIEMAAQASAPVVAIDLPSGIDADTGAVLGTAPKAKLTVTFFRKKPAHLLLPGAEHCGEVVVADIGIAPTALDDIKPLLAENAEDLWRFEFPFAQREGHKYTRGHALIYGGEVMTGAARLAARAAQRIGAGLVTLGAPEKAAPLYSEALESVIVRVAENADAWRGLIDDPKRNALLIGPGLGIGRLQAELVLTVLESKKPCVLDADALTNFAKRPDDLLAKLHSQCVLTPHEGEFSRIFPTLTLPRHPQASDGGPSLSRNAGEGAERLLREAGEGKHRMDKLSRACAAAKAANCIILLKGPDTIIAAPDGRAVINVNAPPWLATAGAGDVLAGMILGLVAQKMPVLAAAAAAAWIHGQIASDFGPGLIAEDLVNGIPAALKKLT